MVKWLLKKLLVQILEALKEMLASNRPKVVNRAGLPETNNSVKSIRDQANEVLKGRR